MNYLKLALGVLIVLSASRFIPHPPNFTSLLALSFYIPAVFGIRLIPVVVLSLLFTDLIIGLHSTMYFTLGSVVIIGLISKFFNHSILFRLSGALTGAIIFYLFTNFGVWLNGSYGYDLIGLIECYTLALPFFGYSLTSTLLFSVIIETVYKLNQNKLFKLIK
tara:strand:+ start:1316 stop:1804 length:489 start_codon:yes stop_codon:yes gene_type:complete